MTRKKEIKINNEKLNEMNRLVHYHHQELKLIALEIDRLYNLNESLELEIKGGKI